MGNGPLIAAISAARNRLRVTGADRVEFLHGQCTNDVKRVGVFAVIKSFPNTPIAGIGNNLLFSFAV
jgi:folate-binding Fe-S cluster repair protein YgfZ